MHEALALAPEHSQHPSTRPLPATSTNHITTPTSVGAELSAQSNNSFDGLRAYLRQLATAAYAQKAAAVDGIELGLMQEAQKFFVLTQTDNLWKEHLQVSVDC